MTNDGPSPRELANDLDQLERLFTGRFDDLTRRLELVARDTSAILAEQARARQETSDIARRVGVIEQDATTNRRLVVGSLIFPVLVVILGVVLTVAAGAGP